MSTKLLEAAKAVISVAESHVAVKSDGDAITRLRAAIAAEEQRIADEQLPATREWILSLPGAAAEDHPAKVAFARPDALSIGLWEVDDGWKAMLNISMAWSFCLVRGMTTRRQVLALLEAMGVKP